MTTFDADLLASRVSERCIPVPETGCFLYEGSWDVCGYGRIGFMERDFLAHRAVMRVHDPKVHVLHKCDTPSCCNPDHLFKGTHSDNMRDMCRKGRARGCAARGERHAMAILDEGTARQVAAAIGAQRDIAARFGISQTTVWAIKSGKRWRHLREAA